MQGDQQIGRGSAFEKHFDWIDTECYPSEEDATKDNEVAKKKQKICGVRVKIVADQEDLFAL